jgi:hypothetical protein
VTAGSSFTVTLTAAATAAEGEGAGFVDLSRGTDVRRLPFWYRIESPKLGTEPHGTIARAGVYHGDTAGKSSLVATYRYPEGDLGSAIPTDLGGPEQVFRFVLKQPVANFGAAVLSHAPGVQVAPRLVFAGDENHLVGYTGIPVDLNPYSNFGRAEPVVGDVLPAPGAYDLVFDTPTGGKPGSFTFRFWIGDTTPPTVRLLTRSVRRDRSLRLAISDGGSGVDGSSVQARIDGRTRPISYRRGLLVVGTARLARGTHRISVTAADYQETKNMEDVGPILPNTRAFTATFVVR